MVKRRYVVLSEECYLDLDHGDVIKNGLRIGLSKREALLIKCLGEDLGHPVSMQKLIDEVWGEVMPFKSALYKCVHRVRKALEDDAHHPVYLLPIKGYGAGSFDERRNGMDPPRKGRR